MKHGFVLCAFLSMLSSTSWADNPLLPPELMFQGKPISPACLERFVIGEKIEEIDLQFCSAAADDIVIQGKAGWQKGGSYGYSYHYKDDKESFNEPYIYYRYLGQVDELPVLFLEAGGGGSGHFTSVVRVKREDTMLRLANTIASGDRCNGGVINPSVENGELTYEVMLTPYDFLEIAEDNPHHLKAYDDLEASAASCFGLAHYEDGILAFVTFKSNLSDEIDNNKEWAKKFRYQSCFNRLYRTYIKDDKTILTKDDLQEFTHMFNQSCVVTAKTL